MVTSSRSEYITKKNITKELIRYVSGSCREHLFSEIKFPKFTHPSRPLKRVSNQEDIRSVTVRKCQLHTYISYYYTSDSLWKIWLVESIQSIHNSLWTWQGKCNICCKYSIYHVKFNVCLVTKPFGMFSSETKWPNASLLFLRMNYVKNV